MLKRILPALPILGIASFIFLYFYAAALYSSATTLHHAGLPYDHFRNYWCDLYVPITYTGTLNPGRPFAMAATLILTATLLFFWLSLPTLFPQFPRLALTIRLTGILSAAAASLIFTPLHDLVITFAVPLGAIAIFATCLALIRKRHWPLLALALLAVAVSLSDYLLWKFQLAKSCQPTIQKSAFILFFLWVVTTTLNILAFRPSPTLTRAS